MYIIQLNTTVIPFTVLNKGSKKRVFVVIVYQISVKNYVQHQKLTKDGVKGMEKSNV